MNRRGFIGALIAALALFRPRPLCVACGSRNHATSLCPINNAAMGGVHSGMFRSGDQIEIYGSDGIVTGICRVEKIDERTSTITISSPLPVNAGSIIVRRASNGAILDDIPYYSIPDGTDWMGLKRS